MSKFTASNGAKVWINRKGFVCAEDYQGSDKVWTQAIREFFQHERDQELGRWRWPDNPQYVVYEDKARCFIDQPAVIVINESDGATAMCGRDGLYSASGIGVSDKWCEPAAAAYFAAHPAAKPWHDAKPGEAWVISYGGEEHAVISDGAYFLWQGGSEQEITDSRITGGRRIWPEGETNA